MDQEEEDEMEKEEMDNVNMEEEEWEEPQEEDEDGASPRPTPWRIAAQVAEPTEMFNGTSWTSKPCGCPALKRNYAWRRCREERRNPPQSDQTGESFLLSF